jgi:hypothetical protein
MVVGEDVECHDRRHPEGADDLDVLAQVVGTGEYVLGAVGKHVGG